MERSEDGGGRRERGDEEYGCDWGRFICEGGMKVRLTAPILAETKKCLI